MPPRLDRHKARTSTTQQRFRERVSGRAEQAATDFGGSGNLIRNRESARFVIGQVAVLGPAGGEFSRIRLMPDVPFLSEVAPHLLISSITNMGKTAARNFSLLRKKLPESLPQRLFEIGNQVSNVL